MLNLLQLDFPVFATILVLLVMGLLSLVFSLYSYSKSRAIQKLPQNLSVNVFNKTFNVFDPYPSKRKMIPGSLIAFFPLFIVFSAVVFSFFVVAKIIETGLLLGLIVSAICIALMALEESFEVHENANILVRAIKNGADLGQGDLTVLSIVKETLPKLRTYYLSLAVIFFAFSIVLPLLLPVTIFALARFLGALIELTASGGSIAPFSTILLFAVVIFMIQVTVGKAKTKIFGFPQPESLNSLNKPFEAMKQWNRWHMHELAHRSGPPEPEKMPEYEQEKS